MEPGVIIKKYGNRRLYDTKDSRYINLDEIARYIREGKQVQVVDAKSGEDLTRVTLTQIITEDAKDKPTGLPLELLRQLIVASDHAGREFLMWYLGAAFDAYRKIQSTVESRLSEVRSAALSPLTLMKNLLGTSPAASSEIELAQLRERVAELEARLDSQTSPKRRKRSKA